MRMKPQRCDLTCLINRKVAVVRAIPPKPQRDPAAVYFRVDPQGVLLEDPRLPWVGQPVSDTIAAMQNAFGVPTVESKTQDVKRDAKVVVVHDQRTNLTRKVNLPRRWAMPPSIIKLVSPGQPKLGVAINPAKGTRHARKTLVMVTGQDGKVVSAEFVS